MSRNQMSAEEAREWFNYDPETGVILWAKQRGKMAAGSIAGLQDPFGYWYVGYKYRNYRHNRLAWLLMTGEWPVYEVDHINGHKGDNQWANLRDVSRTVNCQNQRGGRSKSGLLGVHKYHSKTKPFKATIWINGRPQWLGAFVTAEAAHEVYLAAKRQHHEGNTL